MSLDPNSRFARLNLTSTANPPTIPMPTTPIPGVTVHEHQKRLSEEEEKLVKRLCSLDLGTTWFAPGTEMLDSGKKRAIQLFGGHSKLPTVREAMAELAGVLAAEERQDYSLPLNQVYIDNVGLLSGVNGRILLDDHAFRQLANRYPRDIGLPGNLRQNVNLWLPQVKDETMGFFRTRKPDAESGVRQGYAVLSNRYEVCDLAELAEEIVRVMPQDSRASYFYDGSRGRITVSLAQPFDIGSNEPAVGRMHQIAAVFDTSDDGTLAMSGKWMAVRIRCVNCTLVTSEKLLFKYRHTRESLREVVAQTLGQMGEAMEVFASRWRRAAQEAIVDSVSGENIEPIEIFRRLVACGYVNVPWRAPNEIVELLMGAFLTEPPMGKTATAADINRAITLMATSSYQEWKSPWVQDELAAQAGRLLEQEVFVLPALSRRAEELFAA